MEDLRKLPWPIIGAALSADAIVFAIARRWNLELNGLPVLLCVMPMVVLHLIAPPSKPDDANSEPDAALTEEVRGIAERLGTRPLAVYRYGSLDDRSGADVSLRDERIYVSRKAYETLTEDERWFALTQALVDDQMREEEAKAVRRTLVVAMILAIPLLCLLRFKMPWQTTLTLALPSTIAALVLFVYLAARPLRAFHIRRQRRLAEFTPDPTADRP